MKKKHTKNLTPQTVSNDTYMASISGGKPVWAKRLMNISELADYLGTPKGSIYTMVCLRKIPQECVVKLGRALRFEKEAIDRWITENRACGQ